MSSLDRYREVIAGRHRYAQEWQARTGGKVVGYFCTYVPEELIYALGMLPVRILGSHEPQDLTDRHIFPAMWCAYCRDCLAQGLRGRYHYLDGLVNAWCCQHIRQAHFSWGRHIPVDFHYQLYVPNSIHRPSARACFTAEVREFARALEAWSGRRLSPEALERAVAVYNNNRRLLRRLYELRRDRRPPIGGAEAMAVVLAGQLMDKEEHSRLLEETLRELSAVPRDSSPDGPRLLILGSENDDLELVQFIESLGARVVIDEHCTGSRYFWNQVADGDDLLEAVALRYLDRPPCPQKDVASPDRRRLRHLSELVREYQVQGAIIVQQKFCDPYRYEIPFIQDFLRERGIPSLVLEVEFTLPRGQFRTRIEAFLEMLAPEIG